MIYGLLFAHWFADFVLQTDWMAKNKSKSNVALFMHVWSYASALMMFAIITNSVKRHYGQQTLFVELFLFVGVNAAAHFAIDYVTSRITSKLWQKQQVHNFFVVIGLDQFLHAVTLIYTYERLLK